MIYFSQSQLLFAKNKWRSNYKSEGSIYTHTREFCQSIYTKLDSLFALISRPDWIIIHVHKLDAQRMDKKKSIYIHWGHSHFCAANKQFGPYTWWENPKKEKKIYKYKEKKYIYILCWLARFLSSKVNNAILALTRIIQDEKNKNSSSLLFVKQN